MIVTPVIFCVVVHRHRHHGQPPPGRAASASRRWATSSVLSLLSMLIGLVVGNIFKPGAGMNIDPATLDPGEDARVGHQGD